VSEIADKATGVFLWVVLVLKTLREGYRNGDRLTTLLRKIDDMPEDIERLYEHLLRSIPKADRVSAYRTFAVIMRLVERDEMGMSLMQYSFLEDFEENPMFGVEAPVSNNAKEQCEELPRLERAHNRLRSQCKGLLEVKRDVEVKSDPESEINTKSESAAEPERNTQSESDTEVIALVHRSVYDFFLLEETKKLSELHLRDFDTVDAISQTYLAELKLRGRLRRSAQRDIRAVLSLRKLDNSGDIPPYHFLESLRNASSQVQGTNREAELSQMINPVNWEVAFVDGITSVFYTAVSVGLLDYVSWVLDNDFAVSDNTARFQRVLSVVMDKVTNDDNTNTGALLMVVRFLKQGRLIDDETPIYCEVSKEGIPFATVWEQCMLVAAIRMHSMCEAQRDAFSQILEILLKAGLKSDYEVYVEGYGDLTIYGRSKEWGYIIGDVSAFPRHLFEADQSYSLPDLFDRLQLKNTDTLKRYIRENIAREHASATSNGSSTSGTDGNDGCQLSEPGSPGVGELESLAQPEPEPISDATNTTEADPQITVPAADLALEKTEIVLPSPFASVVPTPRNRRWDFVALHDFTSWYPLITFGLGRCLHAPLGI